MRIGKILVVLTALAVSFGASPQGIAADVAEEITVAARRWVEPLSTVPMAISVVGSRELENSRIRSSQDLVSHLANVDVGEPIGNVFPMFVIRGIGVNDYNVNNNPTVGVYRDDVYLSSNAMIPKVLFDLDRVEVLKGPQGTLYGRNATGGAVNLLSTGPGESFSGYARVGYGNFNTVDVQAAAGGPISDAAGFRVAGFLDRRFSGDQFNRVNQQHRGETRAWGLRTVTTYAPSDNLALRLTLNGGRDASDVRYFQHRGVIGPQCQVATQGKWDPALCLDAFGYHDTDNNKLAGDYSRVPRMHDSNLGATFKAEWTVGDMILTSITNTEGYDYIHGNEEDASPQTVVEIDYDSRIRQVSQELRIASGEAERLRWMAGAFAGRYSHRENRRADIADAERAFGPIFGSPITDLPYRQLTTTAAGFADVQWGITSTVKLEGGLRYTGEKVSYVGGTVLPLLGGFPIVHVDDHITSNKLSWRLNLSYAPRDGMLVYSQVSTGFKSAGFFGGFAFSPAELTPYRPETVTAYEVGAKAQWTPSISVDGAAFIYDYKDLQAVAIGARGPTGGITIPTLTNLPGAKVYGAEVNITWAPSADLSLKTEIGLLDTKIKGPAFNFGSAGAAGPLFNLAGNRLPRSPHFSASETISYRHLLASSFELVSDANIRFRSKAHMDLNNFPMATQSAYATVNGRVAVVSLNQGWEVAAWGKNLTNFIPYLADGPVGFGERDLVIYGIPRTYGLEVRLSF